MPCSLEKSASVNRSAYEINRSHIIISSQVDEQYNALVSRLSPHRIVGFIREDFLIDDAKAVIKEAYISESSTKYLLLAAKTFNTYSQNALLKILEEPPPNIELIIIAPSKSVLLPTVRSRLPIVTEKEESVVTSVDLSFASLDLRALFSFVKEHERLSKHEAKVLIEGMFYQATVVEKLRLDADQLMAFDKAYRLLELNGRIKNILLMILMLFLPESHRVD